MQWLKNKISAFFDFHTIREGKLVRKDFGLRSTELFGGRFPVESSLEYSNEILQGSMAVVPWLEERPPFDLDNVDWSAEHTSAPSTYQLFLQALNPVLYLVGAYRLTSNAEYFDLALDLYHQWARYAESDAAKANIYVWDQHASALRAENILCLLLVGVESGRLSANEIADIRLMLQAHAAYHLDEENYLPGENHGLFQDRSLLHLGYAFYESEWVKVAKERIGKQLAAIFDKDMATYENSFTYQHINKDLLFDAGYILERKGDRYGAYLIKKANLAEDFMGHALMPNGICPPFGDSYRKDYSLCDVIDKDGTLAYASSRGRRGRAPQSESVVYPHAGYYFGRQFWRVPGRPMEFEDSAWTMFRSGFASITHRQADDNSFMFYALGAEIFTDAGVYNYMYRDPIRMYVRSSLAHNMISVDRTSYDFLVRANSELAGFCLVDMGKLGLCDYIVGFNSLYFGVVWFRHFLYFKKALIIIDELHSKRNHTYSQLFHCGPSISYSKYGDSVELCESTKAGKVILRQHSNEPNVSLNAHEGNPETVANEIPFGISGGSRFNELEFTNTLEFLQTERSTFFATSICVDDGTCTPESMQMESFDAEKMKVTVSANERKIEIPLQRLCPNDFVPDSAYRFDNFEISQNGSEFTVEYKDAVPPEIEFAWYVLGNKGTYIIDKSKYSTDKCFTYDFASVDDPNCAIRLFIYDTRTRDKGSQTLCRILKDESTHTWSYAYWPDWDKDWKSWFGGTTVRFQRL